MNECSFCGPNFIGRCPHIPAKANDDPSLIEVFKKLNALEKEVLIIELTQWLESLKQTK